MNRRGGGAWQAVLSHVASQGEWPGLFDLCPRSPCALPSLGTRPPPPGRACTPSGLQERVWAAGKRPGRARRAEVFFVFLAAIDGRARGRRFRPPRALPTQTPPNAHPPPGDGCPASPRPTGGGVHTACPLIRRVFWRRKNTVAARPAPVVPAPCSLAPGHAPPETKETMASSAVQRNHEDICLADYDYLGERDVVDRLIPSKVRFFLGEKARRPIPSSRWRAAAPALPLALLRLPPHPCTPLSHTHTHTPSSPTYPPPQKQTPP
jgi:hypothetical protein